MVGEHFVIGSGTGGDEQYTVEKNDVDQLLSAYDTQRVQVSGTLVGILMVLQSNAQVSSNARKGVQEEFATLVQQLMQAEQDRLQQKKSYASFVTYIQHIFDTYPDEYVVECDIAGAHVSCVGNKAVYTEYMYQLFGEQLPDDIQEGLQKLQDDAIGIEHDCYIVCTTGEQEHDPYGINFVFSLVYENKEATNQELQITHTCETSQEAHELLLRMGQTDGGFDELLQHRHDERTEDELWWVFKDDDIWVKLADKDERLVALLQEFVAPIASNYRATIVETINKHRDRKALLDIYVSENSVGRLTYFLKEHKGEHFTLNMFDYIEQTEEGIVSMRKFSACNPECRAFLHSLQEIIGSEFQASCRGWKEIGFSFGGTVHTEEHIALKVTITAKKNPSFSETYMLSPQQMIALIELVGSGEIGIYDAFDRENDDDYADGYDDYD